MGHVRAVEDEVEGERPWFGSVFVLGADEFVGTSLQGVVFLVGTVGDGVDLCAQGISPLEGEVAETAATVEFVVSVDFGGKG